VPKLCSSRISPTRPARISACGIARKRDSRSNTKKRAEWSITVILAETTENSCRYLHCNANTFRIKCATVTLPYTSNKNKFFFILANFRHNSGQPQLGRFRIPQADPGLEVVFRHLYCRDRRFNRCLARSFRAFPDSGKEILKSIKIT
jgi:hypothetical protein